MCHEESLCIDMEELDDVLVTNNATTASFREGFGRDDLPLIVGIIMTISGNLLSYTEVSHCSSLDNQWLTNLGY